MFLIEDGRKHFYQWDSNRRLIVEDNTVTEVHFCNRTGECSLVCSTYQENNIILVDVPNILLQTDWKIKVYAYDSNYTKYDACYEVITRSKPADYVYTETEIKRFEDLENQIKELEEKQTKELEKKPGAVYYVKNVATGEIFNNENNIASALHSHAEGYWTVASGIDAHAEGNQTIAVGYHSHAEGTGSLTTDLGQHAHAEGYYTTADALGAHAEGYRTVANGKYAHAEGSGTKAQGYASHTEGYNTSAPGENAHAEGSYTNATGSTSHAEGQSCLAAGKASHAEGIFAKAHGEAQHVQGRYNIEDTENKYAHIVGNGTDGSNRSNAHTLDWEGSAWFAGSVEATALILKSPDGKRFRVIVNNAGELTAEAI